MKAAGVTGVLVAGLGLAGVSVMGQEEAAKAPNVRNPPEIVVSAVRDSKPTWQIPANVTVLTEQELKQSGALNLVDAIQTVGGVTMRSTSGNPATAEISMRGFGENSHGRVLVLLDGQKLNRPDMASINWLQIPMGNVERVEILRGGDSALYGDHAVGGIVNIVTRKGSRDVTVDVSTEAGSSGLNDIRLSVAGSNTKTTYAFNGERYQSDGWRARTGFLSAGGGGRMAYDVSDAMNVSVSASGQDVQYEIPGWLSKAQMDQDPKQSLSPNDRAEDKYYNAGIGLNVQPDRNQRGELGLSFGRKDTESDMESWMSYADAVIDTFGATPHYTFDSYISEHKNSFTVGADYYYDRLDVKRFSSSARTLQTGSATVDKETVGCYVRNEFSIMKSLVFGLGARTESADVSAKVDSTPAVDASKRNTENAVSGSLIKTFDDKSKMFVRGGTLYRYPFVDEQVSYVGYGSDQFYSDIKPEDGWNLEAGTDVAMGRDAGVGLTLFMLNMNNEIAYDPMTMRNRNLDRSSRQGVETSVNFAPVEKLLMSANYTYTHAVFADGVNDGKYLPLVPQHKASAAAKVQLPLDLSLQGVVTYVGESYLGSDNSNAGPKLSAYTVTDLFLRYDPAYLDGFEAHAGVENIFDERYASLGYKGMTDDGYYPSPGRSFRVGLGYRF